MKHRTMRLCSYALTALAALAALAGLTATAIIGLGMTSVLASAVVILAGFILTAISATILVVFAQILLFCVRMEERLADLAASWKMKMGD